MWSLAVVTLLADPPDVNSPSPDGKWRIQARWINSGTAQEGYSWTLTNTKTGKVFFTEKPTPDEIFPRRFNALWSPDSRYAALNVYYGRVAYEAVVIRTADTPEEINPLPSDAKAPLEQSLLRREDLPLWDGSGDALTSAENWLDGSTLVLTVAMKTRIKDKVSGHAASLDIEWHKTVKFDGAKPRVIDGTCDTYDKEDAGD